MDIFAIGFTTGFVGGAGLLIIFIFLGTMLNAIKLEWNKEWWNS